MTNKLKLEEKPKYGNWMPKKFILIGIVLTLICTLVGKFVSILWIKIIAGFFGVFCGLNLLYSIYAYVMFSPTGGNLQVKIHNYLINKFSWDGQGKCLEIGCGSAPIAIKLAKKYSLSKIVASDYWEKTYFEYTKQQCFINAQIEGVVDRIDFQFADAAHLPFDNETFDAVISNLTFHEVSSLKTTERYKIILEALRILKKGGTFAFQDLFNMKYTFGDFENLKNNCRE